MKPIKAFLFSTLLATVCTKTIHAQSLADSDTTDDSEIDGPGVTFNVHAGGTYNFMIRSNGDNNVKAGPNGTFGVNVDFPIADKWGIRTGLDYTRLTNDITGSWFNTQYTTTTVRFKQAYLVLPALATYKVAKSLQLHAGLEFTKLLAASNRVITDGGVDNSMKSYLNGIGTWGTGGIEYAYPLHGSHNAITLGVDYHYQFTNIVKTISNNNNSNVNNNYVGVKIGYTF